MTYLPNLCFLDDPIRPAFAQARSFMADVLCAAIRCGTELTVERIGPHHQDRFNDPVWRQSLAAGQDDDATWRQSYHRIPAAAAAICQERLHDYDLVLTYEAPPWIFTTLQAGGICHIDIRIASWRFCPDLILAIACSHPGIRRQLANRMVSPQEATYEATLLAAGLRHARPGQRVLPNDSQLVIGQTRNDASIISEEGQELRFSAFRESLQSWVQADRPLFFKPHPFAQPADIRQDIHSLQEIGASVHLHTGNLYDCFARSQDLSCIGVSSSALSEATCFGHRSQHLYRPVYQATHDATTWPAHAHAHVHAHELLSPSLWHAVIAEIGNIPDCPGSRLSRPFSPNHLRRLHNVSWGYNEAVLQDDRFHHDATRFGLYAQPYIGRLLRWSRSLIRRLIG